MFKIIDRTVQLHSVSDSYVEAICDSIADAMDYVMLTMQENMNYIPDTQYMEMLNDWEKYFLHGVFKMEVPYVFDGDVFTITYIK